MKWHIILGSASPRRRELLQHIVPFFSVTTADIDEDQITAPDPYLNAQLRAQLKANALRPKLMKAPTPALLITSDTIVAIDNQLLNKPASTTEAAEMLSLIRNRWHQVVTSLAIITSTNQAFTDVYHTDVFVRNFSEAEMNHYIASGDPFDKAGAYAIQNKSFRPVQQIRGCYTSVMGLPICRLVNKLTEIGLDFPHHMTDSYRTDGESTCKLCQRLSKGVLTD